MSVRLLKILAVFNGPAFYLLLCCYLKKSDFYQCCFLSRVVMKHSYKLLLPAGGTHACIAMIVHVSNRSSALRLQLVLYCFLKASFHQEICCFSIYRTVIFKLHCRMMCVTLKDCSHIHHWPCT